MSAVALFAASAHGVKIATIASTLRATNSVARLGSRSSLFLRRTHLEIDVLPLGVAAFAQAFVDLSPQRLGFSTPMRRFRSASARSAHAQAAAPLISAMKFRRLIAISG